MIVTRTEIDMELRAQRDANADDSPDLVGVTVDRGILHLVDVVDIGIVRDHERREHLLAAQEQAGRHAVLREVESAGARDVEHIAVERSLLVILVEADLGARIPPEPEAVGLALIDDVGEGFEKVDPILGDRIPVIRRAELQRRGLREVVFCAECSVDVIAVPVLEVVVPIVPATQVVRV